MRRGMSIFISPFPEQIRLYGYAGPAGHYDGIYITDWEGNIEFISLHSLYSPVGILPKMGWDQGERHIESLLSTMTGTSPVQREQFMPFCDMTRTSGTI